MYNFGQKKIVISVGFLHEPGDFRMWNPVYKNTQPFRITKTAGPYELHNELNHKVVNENGNEGSVKIIKEQEKGECYDED